MAFNPSRPVAGPAPGAKPSTRYVICIDPGHPSEVGRGTRGKKITEMWAVWDVAGKMEHLLEEQGVRVVLTKDSLERLVRNKDRAGIANRAGADLMVRLHCDAMAGTGFATYYPDRQGVSGGKRGPSPAVIAASGRAARLFHATVARQLAGIHRDRGLHSDTKTHIGGKQGALTGSIYSEVPVLLVEMCVLTNPKDEAFIAQSANRWKLADAMARGAMAALKARR